MTFPVSPGNPTFEDLPLHEIEDHADRALARLLTQFHEKPVLAALIRIFEKPLQELEGVFWDLRELRTLATAEGEQLDVIGRILDEPRGPLDDTDYRTVLGIKILVLKSSGRAPELMHICEVLVGEDDFALTEYFPAAIAVDIQVSPPPFSVALISRFLHRAKSAGVRLDVWSGAAMIRGTSTLSGGGFGSGTSTLSGGGEGGFGGVS